MVKCPVCKEDVGNKKICRNCGHIIRSEDSIDSNSSNTNLFLALSKSLMMQLFFFSLLFISTTTAFNCLFK